MLRGSPLPNHRINVRTIFINFVLFKTIVLKQQLHCWCGGWATGCRATCSGFARCHGVTLCVIHKLLFRVWVSCVCKFLCFVNALTIPEKILVTTHDTQTRSNNLWITQKVTSKSLAEIEPTTRCAAASSPAFASTVQSNKQ
ncbi:hypothetical protein SFRURICE_001393 [Spodoptera frugiperda]|nr:hypothetical protein SFRURICE_001393 [Spodoptera frugiperda]